MGHSIKLKFFLFKTMVSMVELVLRTTGDILISVNHVLSCLISKDIPDKANLTSTERDLFECPPATRRREEDEDNWAKEND